ncbi:MAG: ABC transporter ATP-binding protein [Alphaproteobacteria bacterium]
MRHNPYIFLVRQAWNFVAPQRGRMVLVYALCITANIVLLFQPWAFGKIVDLLQLPPSDLLPQLMSWCAIYCGLVLVFWCFHGPARIMERRLAFVIFRNFTNHYYAKIMALPLRWHQDHHSGATINRISKAGQALDTFAGEQFIIIQSAVRYIGTLAALCYYAPIIAAGTFLLTGSAFVFSLWMDKTHLIPLYQRVNEYDHRVKAGLFDYISNIVTVITLRLTRSTQDEIDARIGAVRTARWREITLNEMKWCVGFITVSITQILMLLLYVTTHMNTGSVMALGPVVAIFQYLVIINQLFFQFMLSYQNYVRWQTDVRAVDGIAADFSALPPRPETDVPTAWQHLSIRSLTFAHQKHDKHGHGLQQVDLDIPQGRKIALVGSSGAGKTTLLTLLRGLYDPQSVTLTRDGENFADLRPLAALTTLVPQDAEIFENTIHYNLTLDIAVPDEIVAAALHITTFDKVVERLPHGLATDIRERGVNLSGGQKQRLALTRGLIAAQTASLLLLDEPTSHVDITTENLIFDRLFTAMAAKAMIVSVHRLHLLPRFDWICFMQNGKIVQQGTFTALNVTPGPFRDLWQQHQAHHAHKTR